MDIPREIPKMSDQDLRDWFAGQALIGLVQIKDGFEFAELASRAYCIVEAMLAERQDGLFTSE